MERAYAARTRDELEALTRDLPRAVGVAKPQSRRRAKWLTGVAFGSAERKGRWRLPRFAAVVAVFGDADLDLRAVEISGGVVTITTLLLFANADFYVPDTFDVDTGGITVFGHRREHGDDQPSADAPLIRIRAISLFGTSDVWRVAPDARGSFDELIKSVRQRRQR